MQTFPSFIGILAGTASAEEPGILFTEAQKKELAEFIDKQIAISADNTATNQRFDIAFKVGVFIVGALVAVGTAIAALKDTTPPRWLTVSNAALASIATLASALAFSQFDFPKRHAIWERKNQALQACRVALAFPQDDQDAFRRQLEKIATWSDSSNLADLTASCNAENKGAPATKPATTGAAAPAASAASRP